ncbi:MAG TPA: molybdopterin cofactor-binding domain-containing protein, partial [Candidatus Eremiobacteraceae bacterium]|nr:molybdopterin cofactor-binding domain-containing protein [Candidatus Eremiobacteraceae bacterium]
TNKHVAGPVRAPGGPQTTFAKESHLDEVARKLGIDPLDFRLRNAWEDGDLSPTSQRLGKVSVKEALRRAARAIDWNAKRPTDRGRGISCAWWFSSCVESNARVEVRSDGRVIVRSGSTEIGTGSAASALPIFAADVLGIDPGEIELQIGDTGLELYDDGVSGSGSTYGAGMAVENAACDARAKLVALAEDALEARAEDIELHGGRAAVRGAPHHAVALADLAARAGGSVVGAGASEAGPSPEFDESLVESHDFGGWRDPSYTASAAEVDVDRDTGRVVVRKLVTAQDVGFAVNPLGVIGQIEGGAVQGLGWALTEELHYEDGRLVHPGFGAYLLPTAVDAPAIEPIIIEQASEQGPYGVKGVAEASVTTPAGAIANAIADAVGIAPHDTPMTPERVWRALHAK